MNTSYTSLESLLVFQALRSEPVAPSTFGRISEQLQSIPLIRSDPSYDQARLTPEALKDLYLRLLKDEVKRDLEQQQQQQQVEKDKSATNGHLSPGSRKRKVPSPSLPTVHEAAQHAHLIPHLVARLYARYREECIVVVREQERRYDALVQDINDLQAGKWDQKLQDEQAEGCKANPNPPTQPGDGADSKLHGSTKTKMNKTAQGLISTKDGWRSPLPSNGSTQGAVPNPHLPTSSSGSSLAPSPAPKIGFSYALGAPIYGPQHHPVHNVPITPSPSWTYRPPVHGPTIAPFSPQPSNTRVYSGQQASAAGQPPKTPAMAQQQILPQQTLPFPHMPPGQGPQYPATTGPKPQQVSKLLSDIVTALATPPRQPIKPLWRSDGRRPPLSMANMPPRPAVEPLSPTRLTTSPVPPSRPGRGRALSPTYDTETDVRPRKGRRRVNRDRSPHSVTSSTADDLIGRKTRSHSVSTAAGAHAASDDRPTSRGHIKDEPSTPAGLLEDHESGRERSATPASGMLTRKRQGTTLAKHRKSSLAIADDDVDMIRTPPPRSKTITTTRSFAKMSAPIMNDINSHKHASYFAGPVRDRDASGYSDIIKRPQHLKSIRAAITAGTRAVNHAASLVEADQDGILELERTEDLIPPKAIVNGAQLETEVMRMFANAVMFNPGEDGLVSDTREMFEDVEATMNVWRGAEREAVADEDEDTKGKRRKL
ncbi:Hypothetical protein R9X50_00627700 [Acrodontium crateriforme]|uniref:Bromo domain-containing protein n=1 Tax=Acrodontium crateriforme TaxID=150365 RepID=A0AAQ3MAR3_9PEZI|nr:Hypothetical protein R9X50_00627700 [Acrodontium crateriforme]